MENIDLINKKKYNTYYSHSNLDINSFPLNSYQGKMVKIRLSMLKKYYVSGVALDMACGSGVYTAKIAEYADHVYGVDFSKSLLLEACRLNQGHNIDYIESDIRVTPLKRNQCSLIFSFSSLYYVSDITGVLKEVKRLLEPGGVALLEFGISGSLNTLISVAALRRNPSMATAVHTNRDWLYKEIKKFNFRIMEIRRFQILPMWGFGVLPVWLNFFSFPLWTRILSISVKGTMLDEWLSNLFLLRKYAFRHFVVLKNDE